MEESKCHNSFSTVMLFDSSPLVHNFHFMDYHMTHRFSLRNQDQDTGSPDSIFADLFWIFVVDSSAKYTQELNKKKKDPKGPYAIDTCSTKLLSN